MLFAAATHTVRVRFSEEPGILREWVHLEEVDIEPLTCVRRSAWGMLCADDAGNVSKSTEGLAKKKKKLVVTFFDAARFTVSEEKMEKMLLRILNQVLATSPLVVKAAGQRYMHTTQFLYLGGLINASADIMPEIKRRIRVAWACYEHFKRELYAYGGCPVHPLKVRLLKTEVMQTLLYGCVPWTLGQEYLRRALNTTPHLMLFSVITRCIYTRLHPFTVVALTLAVGVTDKSYSRGGTTLVSRFAQAGWRHPHQ